jgi:hypothetical protein
LKTFYDMNQGYRWVRFMKKTRGKKSRATVPLIWPAIYVLICEIKSE